MGTGTPDTTNNQTKDKAPEPKAGSDHAAATSSQQATAPGDTQALAAVRGKSGPNDNLPSVQLTDQQAQSRDKPRTIDPAAAIEAAKQLHDAAFNKNLWGIGWDDPDKGKIVNILEPQSAADRQAIAEAYKTKFGHELKDDLKGQLGDKSEDWSHVQAIMNRKDGASDDAGQVHTALATLDNAAHRQDDRGGFLNGVMDVVVPIKGVMDAVGNSEDGQKRDLAEADVRKTIGNMTSKQLDEARDAYRTNYPGHELDKDLLDDKNLSQGSKDALKILLLGNDKRVGSDPESIKNTLALADVGLKSKNIDIFDQAFQNASPEARKQFSDNNGSKRIEDSFGGDDRDKAKSYLQRGEANLAMFVEGDHHWYHTNKDEITRLMNNASSTDRQEYVRGQELAAKGTQTPDNPDDKQALNFYNRLHGALKDAGDSREVADWESKLLKQEKVITNVLESHNDGSLWGLIGSGNDHNKLYGAVENMSQEDWKRFKDNPDDVKKLEAALRTFTDDGERNKVMSMVNAKLGVDDFEKSKDVGRRSVDDLFNDNKDNPGAKLEALQHMSAAERQQYQADPKHFDELAKQLPEGTPRFEAERLLQQVKTGGKSDAVDTILIDAAKADNPAQTLKDVEAAFKADPTLRDRVNNPQTADDKKLAGFIRDAADSAAMKGIYGDMPSYATGGEYGGGGVEYSQLQKDAHNAVDPLFQNGHVPLETLVQMDKDKDSRRADILGSASEDEKKRLMEEPPHDKATKEFQDRIFGSNEEKELLRQSMKQGKMDDADTFRSYVLGSEGTTPEQLRNKLDAMTADQRQDLANEYYTKYHRLISADVIDKVPNEEKFRFREALSPTDVSVRQINLDARADLQNHTSGFDGVMNSMWDTSKQAAVESNDNIDKFITQHADELDKLTPEQRKQFMDSVNNYQEAIKNYVSSKGQFAEMVVDAAIMVAAVGGAAFTGGGSLALVAALGAGATGAMFRVGAMRAIEGGDFDGSAKNIGEQAFKGFTAAALSFIGPEMLGLGGSIVPVGEAVAVRTAEGALLRATENGLERTAFKVSEDVAQQTIKTGVEQIGRQGAVAGGKEAEAEISSLASKVLGDGATAEQKQILENSIRQELKTNVTKDLSQKVINESEALFKSMATGVVANSGTEVGATVLGFESPDTLIERLKGAAISGAVGAGFFHVGFKAAGEGWKGLQAVVGRDENGLFLGKGTTVESADGKRHIVTDEVYRPAKGDRVVEQVKQGDPLYDNPPKVDEAPGSGRSWKDWFRGRSDRTAERTSFGADGQPRTDVPPERTFRAEEGPPKRDTTVDVDGRPTIEGNRQRIKEEFKPMDGRQFDESRSNVIEDLKAQRYLTDPQGKNYSVYDRLMSDPNMTDAQKHQTLDMLAEVREHYMGLNINGKVLPDQEVNWIHTQGELSRVMDSAVANKLSGTETQDALIASMFSDSAKYGQSAITDNNFWTHHLDGALGASEVLARRGFPAERIDGITQAIREHQIAPPEFMGMLYRMKIEGTLSGQIKAAETAGDTAALEHLNKLKQVLNSDGPEGMNYKTAEGKPAIRQIADVNNMPVVKNGNGEYELSLTPEQRELMKMAGTDHWYVPKNPSEDPTFKDLPKEQQDKMLSQYRVSRALIDGDGIDNYATINGVSKIVAIRGPETFFKDGTVFDSIKSVDTSYNDAFNVLTPEGQRIAQQHLGAKNREIFGSQGKFNDYRNAPPGKDDTSSSAQLYRWLEAQGKNPKDGIPFYNEPLKYPKDGLGPDAKTEITGLRFQLSDEQLSPAVRAQLDGKLTEVSGLNAKQWDDFDFAKRIRSEMTDVLRGKARMDGHAPEPFSSVRDLNPDQLTQQQQFAQKFADPEYDTLSPHPVKMEIPTPDTAPVDTGSGWTEEHWKTADAEGYTMRGPDKSTTVYNFTLGTEAHFDAQGQLFAGGSSRRLSEFAYDSNGQLDRVKFSDSQEIYKAGDKDWKVREKAADGTVTEHDWYKGNVVADGDGTLRYISPDGRYSQEMRPDGSRIQNDGWSRTLNRPDGTKTVYYVDGAHTEVTADGERITYRSNGRTQYESANYPRESLQMMERLQQQFADNPQRAQRFEKLVNEFEKTAPERGLTESDKALLYQQINRIMADNPQAALSLAARADLAEQVLNHAAHPETVDQGNNNTCNVTTVEHRLYYRHPDKVAQLVADVALTGKYTTSTGEVIDLAGIKGEIKPGSESQENLDLQRKGGDRVKKDGSRDFATEITNEVMVNSKYANESSSFIADGNRLLRSDPVAYDGSGRVVGMIEDAKITKVFDEKGKEVWRARSGEKLYDSAGKEITPAPEKLVYDQYGQVRGLVDDPAKLTKLYDNNHQPLDRIRSGQDAFNESGKLVLSRIQQGEITYQKGNPTNPFGGERLVYEHNGVKVELRNPYGKVIDSPTVYTHDLGNINNEIAGFHENTFGITRGDVKASYTGNEQISTPEELGQMLEQMQAGKNLPAVILVHTSGPNLQRNPASLLGLGGGWHVINVDGYDPATKMIKFTNQWGSAYDHLDKPISLNDMFQAMSPSAPKARAALKKLGIGAKE